MKTVGLIPIKLNNQRLPGKNIKLLAGKALCQYLFETASKVDNIDEIYVACSDESICKYIPESLRFIKRPSELDGDDIKSKDILTWFINTIDADIYALMHVTQPFIEQATIETAVEKVQKENYDSAFVAKEIKEFAWYEGKPINYSFEDVVRTQELKPVYVEGELFVFEKTVFTEHERRIGFRPYIQPINWKEAICIDDAQDFEMAQAVMKL